MIQVQVSHVRPLQLLALQILGTAFRNAMEGRDQPEISVQGMGMLRLYIGQLGRLHVWDSRLRYPGVSMVHNHSWDLRSTVIVGTLTNTIYSQEVVADDNGDSEMYLMRRLVTGYECEFIAEAKQVHLWDWTRRSYGPGMIYAQQANEIHRTDAQDGTVTIMERREDVRGEADVFWPVGTEWGTAKPRPATMAEIAAVTSRAAEALNVALQAPAEMTVLG